MVSGFVAFIALTAFISHTFFGWPFLSFPFPRVAARDEPKVRIAYSADGGVSFGPPADVATNTPLGQVSGVALADGSFLVGWVEFAGAQIAYHVRRMANSGNMNESHVVLRSSSLIASSQLACNEGRTYLAWEEMGRGTIQLARLSSELSPCKS